MEDIINTRIYVVDFKKNGIYLLGGDLDLLTPYVVKAGKQFLININGKPILDFIMSPHKRIQNIDDGGIIDSYPVRILVLDAKDVEDTHGILEDMYEIVDAGLIYESALYNKDYLFHILSYLKFLHNLQIRNSRQYSNELNIFDNISDIFIEMNTELIGMYDHLLFYRDNLYLVQFPCDEYPDEEYVNPTVKQITKNGIIRTKLIMEELDLKDTYNK